MGCDIHYVVERKIAGKWVGVYSTCFSPDQPSAGQKACTKIWERRPMFKERDYAFFAALAGVRGEGPPAKGVPSDASELAIVAIDAWSGDGHSHSWDTVETFVGVYLSLTDPSMYTGLVRDRLTDEGCFRNKVWDFMGMYLDDDADSARVIYWFDN